MGAQFLELLKKVTVFMLAGQLIVHFLPAGGYEKYVKMMISIMVLSQIVLPILSLGKFDAAGVYDSAMDKYEQEIEKSACRWRRMTSRAEITRKKPFL